MKPQILQQTTQLMIYIKFIEYNKKIFMPCIMLGVSGMGCSDFGSKVVLLLQPKKNLHFM